MPIGWPLHRHAQRQRARSDAVRNEKGSAGPAIDPLIKIINIVALLIVPLIV